MTFIVTVDRISDVL